MRVPTYTVIAIFLIGLGPLTAQAQLYTWKDADGNAVIKNSPPPWFNSTDRVRGTRVQVLRNGKVVDDTAWPEQRRQEGRNQEARDDAKRAQSEAAVRAQPASKVDSDDD